MPWYRVDDSFQGHPKVIELSLGAVGLWLLAGTWSAKYLTDGLVTKKTINRLGGDDALIEELVHAGLWEAVDEGFQFHDWADYQPLKETVEAERAAARDRMRSVRAAKKGVQANTPRTEGERSDEQPENFEARSEEVRSAPTSPALPSLPDEEQEHVQPAAERSNALESEFAQWWEVVWRRQAKPDAFKAFKAARKDTDLATLIAGAQVYKLATIGLPKDKTKMPAGWLRDRRWEDEPVAYTASQGSGAVEPYAGRRIISSAAPRIENRDEALARECALHVGYVLPCDACKRDGVEF